MNVVFVTFTQQPHNALSRSLGCSSQGCNCSYCHLFVIFVNAAHRLKHAPVLCDPNALIMCYNFTFSIELVFILTVLWYCHIKTMSNSLFLDVTIFSFFVRSRTWMTWMSRWLFRSSQMLLANCKKKTRSSAANRHRFRLVCELVKSQNWHKLSPVYSCKHCCLSPSSGKDCTYTNTQTIVENPKSVFWAAPLQLWSHWLEHSLLRWQIV